MSALKLTPQDISCIRRAHQMIISETNKQYTIPSLAAKVGINRNKLQEGFKRLYGMTIYNFQQQTKLRKAEDLLLTSDKTIAEIATIAGYTDKSSLNKSFRKKHSMSPNSWRNKHSDPVYNVNTIVEPN